MGDVFGDNAAVGLVTGSRLWTKTWAVQVEVMTSNEPVVFFW